MNPPDPKLVKRLFDEVAERPREQRAAFLEQACGGDELLRAQVQSLLTALDRVPEFMSSPTADAVPSDEAAPTVAATLKEGPGTRIGPYKLLQQIGEGGFGVVFLAEQEKPVARRVALKIIKLGMDTRQVVARFEQERQALAMMDHPNIAKVLDAGATETGRPYFVMELVKGDPITNYCDTNNLSVEERLGLFQEVCHAVQHAHQKGIIHRDIKPSNVLVTVADGKPIPKVIDFGIAKATLSKLTEKTLFTEHRALIGTPEYMSPEQAEMSGVDIDTRSDIYSLGVLLYELLTGALPFDSQRLRSAAFGEIQRIIREEDPPNPSTRLSTLATLGNVASHRHTEPARLSRQIRGDLDWIVMKALEKDRTRRYETANGLAADVERHLAGEPVLAAPPSSAYKLRKFVRRNKGPVAAGTAIAATLVIGVIAFAWQAQVASDQRDRAEEQATRATRAEQAEKQRADQLKQVSDFQASMLGQVDPTKAGQLLTQDVISKFEAALAEAGVPDADRPGQVERFSSQWRRVNATDTASKLIDRTILKPAVDAIESQFKDQPVVDAQLRHALAELYRAIGLYDPAQPLQERAMETRRLVLGNAHPDTLASVSGMGTLLQAQGKLDLAEKYLREALDNRRRVLGGEHPDTLESINNMGSLLTDQGRLSEAETYLREALEKYRRVMGETHRDTLSAINNLGSLLMDQDRLGDAEPHYREALEKRRRVLGEDHPHTLGSINNMGNLLARQGKLREAESYFREALEKSRRILGEDHPDTLASINNLAGMLWAQGKLSDAEPYVNEVVSKARRVLGEDHPNTLIAINSLGLLLQRQGRLSEAEPYMRESLEKHRRVLGKNHWGTLIATISLGAILQEQGKNAEAVELLAETEPAARQTLTDANAHRLASLLVCLGRARAALSRFAAAEPNLLEAHAIFAKAGDLRQKDSRACVQAIADLYAAWHAAEPEHGNNLKAEEWRRKLQNGP